MNKIAQKFKFTRSLLIVTFLIILMIVMDCSSFVPVDSPGKAEESAARRLQNYFIWTQAEVPDTQLFAVFRKAVILDKLPSRANFRIFADSRYLLWINGNYVERGPCRFDPKRIEYDLFDVYGYLQEGKNIITVLVHFPAYVRIDKPVEGFSVNARMMAHRPGLAAELELTDSLGKTSRYETDNSWKCSIRTQYKMSKRSYSTMFDVIDARFDSGDLNSVDFDDSSWQAAIPLSGQLWNPLKPRSIPLLREEEVTDLTVAGARSASVKPGPLANLLPMELVSGSEIVINCGRELQAYVILDLEATDGSMLEVYPSTRFFDIGGTSQGAGSTLKLGLSHQYTAREGRQTYISTDTFGCKYIIIRITGGRIKLIGLKVVDRLYPFEHLGTFTSNDKILDSIWQIGVRTVEVCSEDAHVDCSDRERAQWMADGFMMGYPVSRVTMAGPGDNGNPRYADGRLLKNMLRHMAYSQLPDGRLQPMRPSEYPVFARHGVIDDYSCLWVQAVADLYNRDGDLQFVTEVWPVMVRALDYYLKRLTDRSLVHAMEFVYFNNPLAYVDCEGATINAFIYRSLLDASILGRAVRDQKNAFRFEKAAKQILEAYNRELWDEQSGSYYGAIVRTNLPIPVDDPPTFTLPCKLPLDSKNFTQPTGHAALMALYYDLVPPERKPQVFKYMQEHFPDENAFPYTYYFFLETLYKQDNEEMDRAALNTIRDKWAHMVRYETGTVSEGWTGGSFVHESGAHPSYFLSAFVLGVRTEGSRENRNLIIDPRLGDINFAEGTILTEFGPVDVKWHKSESQILNFNINNRTDTPSKVTCRLSGTKNSLIVDGKSLLKSGKTISTAVSVHNGRVHFRLSPGRHSGQIIPEN